MPAMTTTDDDDRGAQRSVQSVEVGGRLLLALAGKPAPMTLKDLAARAELSASRAHPYLVSFARLGLIEQDEVTGRYALGPAAFQIGLACLHQADPIKAAVPAAEALARRIDQTVAIAVWANFGPTIVRLIDGSRPLLVNMRVGTVMAPIGTATGEAFAATLPRQQLEQALEATSGGDAERVRAESRQIARALKQIGADFAEHGLTRAAGRPIPGVNAFSAPVRDHEGRTVLVITALGHADDVPTDWRSPIAQAVRAAAAEVSARLGWAALPQAKPAAA